MHGLKLDAFIKEETFNSLVRIYQDVFILKGNFGEHQAAATASLKQLVNKSEGAYEGVSFKDMRKAIVNLMNNEKVKQVGALQFSPPAQTVQTSQPDQTASPAKQEEAPPGLVKEEKDDWADEQPGDRDMEEETKEEAPKQDKEEVDDYVKEAAQEDAQPETQQRGRGNRGGHVQRGRGDFRGRG